MTLNVTQCRLNIGSLDADVAMRFLSSLSLKQLFPRFLLKSYARRHQSLVATLNPKSSQYAS